MQTRLLLISCDVLYREMCLAASRSVNLVDLEFVSKGLHDIGSEAMCSHLQEIVDGADKSLHQAVLLGYGLCNNGAVGLKAGSMPLVIPRAHDCITLFMGSKERYLEYFNSHPGVYFKTSGWIERGKVEGEFEELSVQRKMGLNLRYEQLVEKYGEDNAKYLLEALGDNTHNYGQFTYIEMGVEPDDRFERHSRELAGKRGWKFEKLNGDMGLIQALVDGAWDEERFLVVQPGQRVVARYDGSIIGAEQD
jgi:hypothetical protein